MTRQRGRPAVFFDRDGIVNVSPGPGYVERLEAFHLQPSFIEALRVVTRKGFPALIITNQRGVGKGIMTQAELDRIHAHLRERLAMEGLGLLDIYVCTELDRTHPRRKPNPTMLLEAAATHGLDLGRSWMVGDAESDVEAGRRAGCRTVKVGTASKSGLPSKADFQVKGMEQLPALLERVLDTASGA